MFGRSIGSGPATYLASKYKIGGLILLSPFISIKTVIKDHIPFLSCLVKERFNNLEKIKLVTCNILIVHGKMDKMINY